MSRFLRRSQAAGGTGIVALLAVACAVPIAVKAKPIADAQPDRTGRTGQTATGRYEAPPAKGNEGVALGESKKPVWRKRFDSVYRLKRGEDVRRIAPPFIPERTDFYRELCRCQRNALKDPPDSFSFMWSDRLAYNGCGYAGSQPLDAVLIHCLGLRSYEYEGPVELLKLDVPGDWIVRSASSKEQRLKALERILREQMHQDVRFERRRVERNVIAARGKFRFHPLKGTYKDEWIHIYAERLDSNEGAGGGSGSITALVETLGNLAQLKGVNLSDTPDEVRVCWGHHYDSYLKKGADNRAKLERILANVARQTSLELKAEKQTVDVWFLVPNKPA